MTPPVTGGDGDGHDPVDHDTAERPVGQREPVSVALRELAPPEHTPSFWDDLDRRLADEPQLRLAPRAAIRHACCAYGPLRVHPGATGTKRVPQPTVWLDTWMVSRSRVAPTRAG